MIAFEASDMTKACVGSTEVSKAYLGSDLVWGGESPVLPYNAEVEYLQSSGTQYIQLTCSAPKGSFFAVGGVVTPIYVNTNGYAIFGANPYQQFLSTFYSRNSSSVITYASQVGASATRGGWGGKEGNELSFELSTAGKTTNGTYTVLSRPLTANITAFRIFGGYRNSNRYPIKIKSFYIISGDTKLYDLIAVRVGQVGYMYDKISGELFGNNGTGSFTLGPDVS